MKIKISIVRSDVEVKFCSKQLEEDFKNCLKKIPLEKQILNYNSDLFFYIAECEHTIVGFLYSYIISKSGQLTYHSIAILEKLTVDSTYRNFGIGSSLLETFLDHCVNYNVKIMETETFFDNDIIKHLYSKLNLRKYCYRISFGF